MSTDFLKTTSPATDFSSIFATSSFSLAITKAPSSGAMVAGASRSRGLIGRRTPSKNTPWKCSYVESSPVSTFLRYTRTFPGAKPNSSPPRTATTCHTVFPSLDCMKSPGSKSRIRIFSRGNKTVFLSSKAQSRSFRIIFPRGKSTLGVKSRTTGSGLARTGSGSSPTGPASTSCPSALFGVAALTTSSTLTGLPSRPSRSSLAASY